MRFVGLLAPILLAAAAHAAPVATASEDLDGDGAKDVLELAANGTLTLGARTVNLGVTVTRGRIEVGRWDGKPIVVAVADTQAFVLQPSGTGWSVSAKVPVGGVGLDSDYRVDVAATPEGVYRFQARDGLRRCDGKPALLFAEGFNGKVFGRVKRIPTGVADSVPKLVAKPDPSAPLPVLYAARFSSHQIGAGDAGGLGAPTELGDGKPTMWREEMTSAGEGQFFTFEARARGVNAKQVRIASAGKQYNRPRWIAIVGAKAAYRVELPDDTAGTGYVVDLPQAIEGCVTVILETTYGPATGQTAIAELGVFADGERTGSADAMLAKLVADGNDGAIGAGQALAKRGALGAAALEAEIAKATNAVTRRRLLAVLVKIDDPAAVPSLMRAATEGWAGGDALVEIVRALGKRGVQEELAQLAAKNDLEIAARVAAASALSPSDAKGMGLLVDLAGTGPHAVRKVVIDRLALAPIDALVAAAQKETEAASAGDLWRASTKRARTTPADHAAALAAQTAALPAAQDYERRYRLIDGIATLGDAAALRGLAAMLAALPANAISAALRQAAIAGAASAPRVEALSLVVGLAKDPDPGVRLAVIGALAGTEADAATPWHAPDPDGIDRILVAALATDTWPDVRRRAASSLGSRCQRPGPRLALVDAAKKATEDVQVRGDSLIALVQCTAPGTSELLASVWDDTRAPIELRTQAVGLAAVLGDATLGATLVAKFTRWRGAAMGAGDDGEAALSLAQAAAPVIAILDAPGAARALEAALDDEAFPEIIAAAAMGLGKLGPKCPASAKARLVEIGKGTTDAARPAELAATGCGGKAR